MLRSLLADAFQQIVKEVLQQNLPPSEVLNFAVQRLRELGKEVETAQIEKLAPAVAKPVSEKAKARQEAKAAADDKANVILVQSLFRGVRAAVQSC
jgi:hypothetical protein